ncbi:MAG TPA: hypothetical protein VJQ57_14765 [Acidimicrobiia bacterium]|nr:hypothetical protein [Acidimicrobiia bacterium]
MTTISVDQPSLQSVLGWATSVFAAAGGLIHLEAAVDHRHLTVVAIGFAVMAVAQFLFAGSIISRPSISTMVSGGALHLAIFVTWILSRTVGLQFIPGAEASSAAHVADIVANTFSITVVGVAGIWIRLCRSRTTVALPAKTDRAMRTVILAGVAILTVVALIQPHDHAEHHVPASLHGGDHEDQPLSP